MEICRALRASETTDGKWIFVTLTAPLENADAADETLREILSAYGSSTPYFGVVADNQNNWHFHAVIYGRMGEVTTALRSSWSKEYRRYRRECYAEAHRDTPIIFNDYFNKAIAYIRRHTGKFLTSVDLAIDD